MVKKYNLIYIYNLPLYKSKKTRKNSHVRSWNQLSLWIFFLKNGQLMKHLDSAQLWNKMFRFHSGLFWIYKSAKHHKWPLVSWPCDDCKHSPSPPVSGHSRACYLMHCHISVLGRCITQMNISVRWGKVMFWCNYHLLLPVIVSDLFWTIISWWTSGTEPSSLFIVLHSGKTQLNWGLSY